MHLGGHTHLLNGDRLTRDRAGHGRDPVAILENIHPVARQPADFVCEVGIPLRVEFGLVLLRHHRPEHRQQGGLVEHRLVLHANQIASSTENGRLADAQVQIGRFARHLHAQQALHSRFCVRFCCKGTERFIGRPTAPRAALTACVSRRLDRRALCALALWFTGGCRDGHGGNRIRRRFSRRWR